MSRPAVEPCGTRAAYARGCRCEPCRQASRTYHRRQRTWQLTTASLDTVDGLATVSPPGAWIQQAACAGLPADLFFPTTKGSRQPEIRTVCSGCPVQSDCLAWAVENHFNDGWFGGVPPRERRKIWMAGK